MDGVKLRVDCFADPAAAFFAGAFFVFAAGWLSLVSDLFHFTQTQSDRP